MTSSAQDPGYQGVLNSASASFLDQSSATFLDQSSVGFMDQSSATFLDQSSATFIDQSSATFLDSNPAYGHATLCAGVIAAVAPGSMIMPLRVFDDSGQTDVFSVTKAIYYAVRNGAKVINMSFGMSQSYSSIKTALAYAANNNVVVVASAGNQNSSTPQFPASAGGVIGVAAVSSTDAKASFSNYGTSVYVDAPGVNIISSYPNGRYAMVSGTSFSAPIVAGEAALIISEKNGSVKTTIGAASVNIDRENPAYCRKVGSWPGRPAGRRELVKQAADWGTAISPRGRAFEGMTEGLAARGETIADVQALGQAGLLQFADVEFEYRPFDTHFCRQHG